MCSKIIEIDIISNQCVIARSHYFSVRKMYQLRLLFLFSIFISIKGAAVKNSREIKKFLKPQQPNLQQQVLTGLHENFSIVNPFSSPFNQFNLPIALPVADPFTFTNNIEQIKTNLPAFGTFFPPALKNPFQTNSGKHEEHNSQSGKSYRISYNNSLGKMFARGTNGVVVKENYDNRNQLAANKMYNQEAGIKADWNPKTGKNVYTYNRQGGDANIKHQNQAQGTKFLYRIGNGTLVNGTKVKGIPYITDVSYNHTGKEEASKSVYTNMSNIVNMAKNGTVRLENYNNTVNDLKQKMLKNMVGQKQITIGNKKLKDVAYNETAGDESGMHNVMEKGTKDVLSTADILNNKKLAEAIKKKLRRKPRRRILPLPDFRKWLVPNNVSEIINPKKE